MFAPARATAGGAATAEAVLRDEMSTVARERCGALLVADPQLDEVARTHAQRALLGFMERASMREALWAAGVRDYEFELLTLVAASPPGADALGPVIAGLPALCRTNTVGVGAATGNGNTAMAAIAIRRVARFLDAGSGERVLLDPGYVRPAVFETAPDGRVERRELLGERGEYWLEAAPTATSGMWMRELMADGPRGPEILALWPHVVAREATTAADPLGLGPSPYAGEGSGLTGWIDGSRPGPDRAPTKDDALLAEDRAWDLVRELRRGRGLPTIARDPAITRAARAHARDIARGESFGHATSSGTALDRLARESVVAVRAVENVARAADVASAQAALLASPSHRANLLDAAVTDGGVGVAVSRGADGRWSVVVTQLFAEVLRGEDGDLGDAVIAALRSERAAAGLSAVTRRPLLDTIATEAAREAAEAAITELDEARRRAIVEAARFRMSNATRIAVDLVMGPDTRVAGRAAHALDAALGEVGVGVARLPRAIGELRKGSVAIVLVWVAR